jgi:hypothetical protein
MPCYGIYFPKKAKKKVKNLPKFVFDKSFICYGTSIANYDLINVYQVVTCPKLCRVELWPYNLSRKSKKKKTKF